MYQSLTYSLKHVLSFSGGTSSSETIQHRYTGSGFLHASPNADCIEVYGGCMKKHIMITCIFVVWKWTNILQRVGQSHIFFRMIDRSNDIIQPDVMTPPSFWGSLWKMRRGMNKKKKKKLTFTCSGTYTHTLKRARTTSVCKFVCPAFKVTDSDCLSSYLTHESNHELTLKHPLPLAVSLSTSYCAES